MAVNVLTAVFKYSRSRGSARLVLLALADVASDTGEVTAYARSQSILAAMANIAPKTVPKAIDAILELGEVVLLDEDGNEHDTRQASGRGRRRTDYRIKLPGIGADPAVRGDRQGHPQTPPDAGSAPADGEGQTPPDAGSITPSLSGLDPSTSVSPSPPAPAKAQRKHRLPDDFAVDLAMRAWAQENAPLVDVDRELDRFADYWRGRGDTKADWIATWRNWMRKAQEDLERAPRRVRPPRPTPPLSPRRDDGDAQGGRVAL